jgi:hypothetical protein
MTCMTSLLRAGQRHFTVSDSGDLSAPMTLDRDVEARVVALWPDNDPNGFDVYELDGLAIFVRVADQPR